MTAATASVRSRKAPSRPMAKLARRARALARWSAHPSRLLVSLGFLVLGVALLCAGLWFRLAGETDAQSEQHIRVHLVGNFEDFRAALGDAAARSAEVIAAHTTVAPRADLSPHLAPSGQLRYPHRAAYLVGADGEMAAVHPAGAMPVPPEVASLVAGWRAEHLAGRANVGLARSGPAAAATDILMVGGRPAVAAIAFVPGAVGTDEAVLVMLTPLDAALVESLERTSGANGLRFETEPSRAGAQLHSQLDRRGRIVGWFSWEAQRPMADAMRGLWPLHALAGMGFLGFAALSVYQLGRTERGLRASKVQVQKIAQQDALTGLPNRRKTFDLLDAALAARAEGQVVAFGFIDLDGFKEVNGQLGHESGDQLLAAVAGRLQAAMPASAAVGRIGGDEFAVVLTVDDPSVAIAAADAGVRALSRPFWIAGQAVQIGASIGLSESPRDGVTRSELARRADLALRTAKQRGRGSIVGFERGIEQEMSERRFIERELPRALADEELEVHYQPIVAGDGLRIVGVEALARWRHPARGHIPPAVFVSVAEQAGMMAQLGKFVLRRALADAKRWGDLFVAVNLSPLQVRDRTLVDLVSAVIDETGIAPARVVLEITEGVLIENPEEAKQRLKELRALGVRIALDDFGSGYSSLSYLRRLPIDKLKIDKEFVAPLGRSANGGVIVQAIIALGRALGLSVLAEGVETEEQRILLRLAGCDEMQGFLFARPMPHAEVDAALRRSAQQPAEPLSVAAFAAGRPHPRKRAAREAADKTRLGGL